MAFKSGNRVALLAALTAGFFMAAPAFAGQEGVAKVGSVTITKYELQREQQRMYPTQVSYHGGISPEKLAQIREEAYNKLVERAYKVQYALNEEIAVDNATVDGQIEAIRAKFKSKSEFKKAFGDEGLAAYRASVYRELLAKKAEAMAVDSKVTVTDAQVREFFDKNKANYKRPRQFKASHIMVKVDPSSNAAELKELQKKADDLFARAKAGEDFYNLAYYNSDDRSKFVGGDLGTFHEGQTVKEFEDALRKMKPGEISEPIKTMYGYHIIKLVEVNEPRQLNFDEVKDKIRETLEKQQREAAYEKWMAELKAKYPVQRLDR